LSYSNLLSAHRDSSAVLLLCLRVFYLFRYIGLTNRVIVKFGATTIFDTGAQNVASGSDWQVTGMCERTGANTQKCTTDFHSSFGTLSSYHDYATAAETSTQSIVLDLRGNGTSANDTTKEMWRGWFDPTP